ncbi:adenylyl-sulfate kinase, partial [Patescibacteria group bacterium]|nr:adenylyl-sulfate kinase [Patescibacteria group bacterium]
GNRRCINVVIVGHVDHGKSTIIGRLFADTNSLPEGKLEQVKENCRKQSKSFEYAFLVDALKDEQMQGITIDSARCFFKSKKRDYAIIDAPGHIEFLKNMVVGASRAEAAILVIDACEGIQENSRRHAYMLSMLGIQEIIVLVNKMDLVFYAKNTFEEIVREYKKFLKKIKIKPRLFIPVSGIKGDNIISLSSATDWYKGPTVLEALDAIEVEEKVENKPFRMPVQDVYKFTKFGDDRRIVAGTIESGFLSVGDKVDFYPSGKKSTVKSIELFNEGNPSTMAAGSASAFTLTEQIYVTRGELVSLENQQKPEVTSRMRVSLFWLDKEPMVRNKIYYLKVGTAKVAVELEEIIRIIDTSSLRNMVKRKIERHDVAECILKTRKAIAFDVISKLLKTSRFVVVNNCEIAGGGIIQEALKDEQSWIREKVILRNYKWENTTISSERRAEKYNQKPTLVLITGQKHAGRKKIAKMLEEKLFANGKIVYFLKLGNMLYGVDADIKTKRDKRKEHLRRLAEVAHIMLDAGMILIVTAQELTQNDLENIRTTIGTDKVGTVWIGKSVTTDIKYDLHIPFFRSGINVRAIDVIRKELDI